MDTVGAEYRRPSRSVVRAGPDQYVIALDVADFTDGVLSVESLGPCLTVRGEEFDTEDDEGWTIRRHDQLEESLRLPDDADPDRVKVFYEHGRLEIHAPRVRLEPRQLPIEHPPPLVNPNATPC